MVTEGLNLQYREIDKCFCQNVNEFIEGLISKHSKNTEMMNLMALEATALARSVNSRSRELEEQGFISRAWNAFTGSNQKVAARNSQDLAHSQYLGQQMLNKLAENNLMTYQMVVALGDKVNRVAKELNSTRQELIQVNQTLAIFFSKIREKLESKFAALERNDDLLFWKNTIKYEPVYHGKEYGKLNRATKIVCLANEFFRYSQQLWSPRDLSFLKSVIEDAGEHPNEKILLREVYEHYFKDEGLLIQLFKGIENEPNLNNSTDLTPTLLTFKKLQALESYDSPIVDIVLQYAPEKNKAKVILDLAEAFVMKESGRNLSLEVTVFDAVMELVEDLTLYKRLSEQNLVIRKEKRLAIEKENKVLSVDTKGTVLQLHVEKWQHVSKGDVVITLEADGYEIDLCSPVAGRIDKVYVANNDLLEKNASIVRVI